MRGVARFGPAQSRFVSIAGIVALYREEGERLRGSFRLQVSQRSQKLLGGWTKPHRYLMQGEFNARPDESRGRQIVAETESDGWERGEEGTGRGTGNGEQGRGESKRSRDQEGTEAQRHGVAAGVSPAVGCQTDAAAPGSVRPLRSEPCPRGQGMDGGEDGKSTEVLLLVDT
jgi:hypothetical protein